MGYDYASIVGGDRVRSGDWFSSTNPAAPDEVVERVSATGRSEFERAMQAAQGAFETWSRTDPAMRARVLLWAAAAMRRRRDAFSAWLVLEVGKPWAEADADTAEAIDFLEFYAREMMRPPFNFPLAVACGMVADPRAPGSSALPAPGTWV